MIAMTDLEDLRQQSTGSFRALFEEDQARVQLYDVRFWLAIFLCSFTILWGIIPLFLRWNLEPARVHWYLSRVRKDPDGRGFVHLVLCVLGGQLLVAVCVNIFPLLRSFIHSDHMEPNTGIYVCAGFIFTYVLQEIISLRFGNTSLLYAHECHMCIVQFIRCELNLGSKLQHLLEGKEAEVNDDDADDYLISGEDVDSMQTVLGVSADEATTLHEIARANGKDPVELPVKHWRKISEDFRRKNPKMDPTVCVGVIMLCLHSIPDGFFMGLQPDQHLTMYAFLSLLFHRCVISLLMAIELLAKNFSTKSILFVVVAYSLTAPIGSLLASLAASEEVGLKKLAILLGMSGGSLLYVAVIELFKSEKGPFLKPPAEGVFVLMGGTFSLVFNWVARRRSHFWEMFM